MTRKIIFGVVVLLLGLAASIFYFGRYYRPSRPGKAELTNGELTIKVSYSRPLVKGRLIFGTADQEALLPYGKYWRLGANEATEITFSHNVNFNGQPVEAGTYSIYAVPGEKTFDIALNREINKSGSPEPDYSQDVLHTEVPVQETEVSVEKFTIRLQPFDKSINLIIDWANFRLIVPVSVGS